MASDAPESNGNGSSALFSTDAVDNAEVVHDHAPRGPESVWSTTANVGEAPAEEDAPANESGSTREASSTHEASTAHEASTTHTSTEQVGTEPAWAGAGEGDAWQHQTSTHAQVDADPLIDDSAPVEGEIIDDDAAEGPDDRPGADSAAAPSGRSDAVFSAEPADRGDIIDEREVINTEPAWSDPAWHESTLGRERAAALFANRPSSAAGAEANWDPWRPAEEASTGSTVPPTQGRDESVTGSAPGPGTPDPTIELTEYSAAVEALDEFDRERAEVPLMVAAALLDPAERVHGVVTGQMLGRPAAVVVAERRVVIVNDRRWDPIIDMYSLDSSLVVRGRRDQHVAAMSFADDESMSIVDDIRAADRAVRLAELIRDAGIASH